MEIFNRRPRPKELKLRLDQLYPAVGTLCISQATQGSNPPAGILTGRWVANSQIEKIALKMKAA
ncbi:MAG TPA: hypothetical protein VGZ24_10375 [Chthoniobacterales bacterium]|nr:hypothetical protein [Chthoniobacterales bacterium]